MAAIGEGIFNEWQEGWEERIRNIDQELVSREIKERAAKIYDIEWRMREKVARGQGFTPRSL